METAVCWRVAVFPESASLTFPVRLATLPACGVERQSMRLVIFAVIRRRGGVLYEGQETAMAQNHLWIGRYVTQFDKHQYLASPELSSDAAVRRHHPLTTY
ncbi:MAG: hypothetical protein JWO19_6113 [Bryobacterales bacterium]|nr:hypothetical protein [Bryobacterales bacterium]